MITFERFLLGTAIIIALVLAVAAAQGIGEAFGHGIREMLVR